jgi:hypothetical protein
MSNGKNLTSLNQPITLTRYLILLRKGHFKMTLKQNKNPPKKIQNFKLIKNLQKKTKSSTSCPMT